MYYRVTELETGLITCVEAHTMTIATQIAAEAINRVTGRGEPDLYLLEEDARGMCFRSLPRSTSLLVTEVMPYTTFGEQGQVVTIEPLNALGRLVQYVIRDAAGDPLTCLFEDKLQATLDAAVQSDFGTMQIDC